MNTHRWVRVTDCDNVPPREGREVTVGTRRIAIFNLGDRFLATDNSCPHRGGPLSDGIVTGSCVVCPLHQWKISLEDGDVQRPASMEVCVETYPIRVEDGVIVIGVPVAEAASKGQAA